MAKNGNGWTTKDMFKIIMDNQDKANDKWSGEFKRLYDKLDDTTESLRNHDAGQDKKIARIETKQNLIVGIAGAIGTALLGAVSWIMTKIFNR